MCWYQIFNPIIVALHRREDRHQFAFASLNVGAVVLRLSQVYPVSASLMHVLRRDVRTESLFCFFRVRAFLRYSVCLHLLKFLLFLIVLEQVLRAHLNKNFASVS